MSVGSKSGAQHALIPGALDDRLEQWRDPVACLVGALLPEVRVVDDVGQPAVLQL